MSQTQQDRPHGLRHETSQIQLRSAQRPSRIQPIANKAIARRQGTITQTPASNKRSIFSGPKVDDPDPAADRLDDDETPLTPADFYELMGMRQPVSKQQNPKELAIRNGLYARVQHRFSYIQAKYRIFDIAVYVFLILQLLLSATFIVLGSLQRVDTHLAIALLGAISTVIAGSLALMKGNGLPNRLMQTRDALRNVLFAAEELYWDVGADRPVKYKDVRKIREDFLRVLEEERRNQPDTWNPIATGVAQGVKAGAGAKPTLAPGATPKP